MRVIIVILILLAAGFLGYRAYDNAVQTGALGKEREAGVPSGPATPAPVVLARQASIKDASPEGVNKQILFGDLHVHTTYSTDAFLWALPINQGKGVHPVADACDFARYCSAIDFWSITDHAEALTPIRWERTKEAIRQCQARSDSEENPDLISLLGFEWTQVGAIPDEHFGHKNVIFQGLADKDVAARPIAAVGAALDALRNNVNT
ncbi:MAG: DUF3604 domain-containing protein, partial [Pseudomonadota bacterium]